MTLTEYSDGFFGNPLYDGCRDFSSCRRHLFAAPNGQKSGQGIRTGGLSGTKEFAFEVD
jgi:hypothetical protein